MKKLLKKRIHPVLGYAFLFSAGILSINQTMDVSEPVVKAQIEQNKPGTITRPTEPVPDLSHLKTSAVEFASQLAIVKSQAQELEKLGRIPPQELFDAIGEGEQLVGIINHSSTLSDLGAIDAGKQMQLIAKKINENSKF